MASDTKHARFAREVLPHLDAAYNLARWLLKGGDDAQDVTQEAVLRAFRYFDGFRGDNAKAWLLSIVRNCCYSWLRNRPGEEPLATDEDGELEPQFEAALAANGYGLPPPDARLIEAADRQWLHDRLAALPAECREILVLRELEELSYKEISDLVGIPMGTVMSRLSRARSMLLQACRRSSAAVVTLPSARRGDRR